MSDPKTRIRRILNIIPYVRKNPGVPVEELARYCGAEPSEVLSDLDRILLCGVPPYLPDDYIGVYVDGGRVEVRFADHFRRPVRFTPTEALALLLAIDALPDGGDQGYVDARRSLTDKIRKVLSSSLAPGSESGQLEGRIETATGSGGQPLGPLPARRRYRAAIAVLKPAIADRFEVELDYYSASQDEVRVHQVRPYGLIEKQGDLYLIGQVIGRDQPSTLRVDRILLASRLEGTFEMPARFSLERFEKKRMDFTKRLNIEAKVRITNDDSLVRWLRETSPADVDESTPGEAIITKRAYSMPWLINEILSFGPAAEVIEPPEVRARVHEHLCAMRDRVRAARPSA